jgi:hypothetical protein
MQRGNRRAKKSSRAQQPDKVVRILSGKELQAVTGGDDPAGYFEVEFEPEKVR